MKKKIIAVLLILVFLYCVGGVAYSIFVNQKDNRKKKEDSDILRIEGYEYFMHKSKVTNLYKEEFLLLKDNLESDKIDFDSYASSIAKLYIIDFYTLNNKINKYDIGSVQFVYNLSLENFKLKASETIYKYIIDNTNSDRNQTLPEVKEVLIDNINKNQYTIESKVYDSYEILLNWSYKEDLGYDTSAKLVLINDNSIISVVEESRG